MNSHTIQGNKILGGLAILTVYTGMVLGPMSPLVVLLLFWFRFYIAGGIFSLIILVPFLYDFKTFPVFCRFFLNASGWFKGGATIWYDDILIEIVQKKQGMMLCYHPHGIGFGFGFTLNGAIRWKSMGSQFLPKKLFTLMSIQQIKNMNGIAAEILFKFPILRLILQWFGCATPASKKEMCKLFKRKSDFGILPGGMEEVAIYKQYQENVYIKKRAGFIKYALEYGYTLIPCYTFGENDCYKNINLFQGLRKMLIQKFGFVLPNLTIGKWWCPLLPQDDKPINTVLGNPIYLPLISQPSKEDVEKYHQIYIQELNSLYENHKEKFGYKDRSLNFY